MANDHHLILACRCCRINIDEPNMVKLAEIVPNSDANFDEILTRLTGIERKPYSEPSAICVKCSTVLIATEKLRILTIESDKFFRNWPDDVKVEKKDSDGNQLDVVELSPPILFEEVETEIEDDIDYESPDLIVQKENKDSKKKKKTHKSANAALYRLPSRTEFACCMCIKFCDTKEQLEKHLRSHTLPAAAELQADNPKECWMCLKGFKDDKNLRLHQVRRYRPKTSLIYQCKYCGKIFQKPASMRYCEQKHEGKVVKYYCDLCKATATSKTNLKTHMRLMHISEERKFPCSECGYAAKMAAVLQRHMLTHSKIRNFSCELCGNRFTTSSALKVHRRVHTGERPYTCEHPGCGKTFIHATDCHRHKMSHTGERPYPCSHCDKRFRTGNLLKMHFRMHIGVREFRCKLCSVEYFQPRSLKRHMAEKHSGYERCGS